MQVFSTFENTGYLELAICHLEKNGILKSHIFAVPLDNRSEDRKIFDTLHRSDGFSMIDIAAALATAFAVIGASYGFILEWGPIYWGLIGGSLGGVVGFGIKFFYLKVVKKKQRLLKGKHGEVILIVECNETNVKLVEEILWNHFALGVAKIK
jgi:hypothetical protein